MHLVAFVGIQANDLIMQVNFAAETEVECLANFEALEEAALACGVDCKVR